MDSSVDCLEGEWRHTAEAVVWLQDFLVEDRPISLVGDHLTGSLAEPKATIVTRRLSADQVQCGPVVSRGAGRWFLGRDRSCKVE